MRIKGGIGEENKRNSRYNRGGTKAELRRRKYYIKNYKNILVRTKGDFVIKVVYRILKFFII